MNWRWKSHGVGQDGVKWRRSRFGGRQVFVRGKWRWVLKQAEAEKLARALADGVRPGDWRS